MEKVLVEKFPITLAQFLKWAGLVINGGEAKILIRNGLVNLNGKTCLIAGQKLAVGDLVTVQEKKFLISDK